MYRVNGGDKCRCNLKKIDKSVQTDDVEHVVSLTKKCSFNNTNKSDQNYDNDNNKSNQPIYSAVSSNKQSTIFFHKRKQPILPPRLEYKNRQQTIESTSYHNPNWRIKSPIFARAIPNCNFDQTNTENSEPNQLKDTNNKKVENKCHCPISCDKWYDCAEWKQNNINFDNYNNAVYEKESFFLKQQDIRHTVNIDKIINDQYAIHGQYLPKCTNLDEIKINEKIQDALCEQNDVVTDYSLITIARNLNLMIIDQKQIKNYYLPIICTNILDNKSYRDLSSYKGPLVIIVTPFENTSKKMYEKIQYMYRRNYPTPKIQAITDRTKDIRFCDILIIDIVNLILFLKRSKLSIKRCCHLIIENLDVQISTNAELLTKFLNILNEMLLNRPSTRQVQFIATSDIWMQNFIILLKKLKSFPTIIFNDCLLDIAIYSNCNFIGKFLKADHMKFHLADTVQKFYQTKRIIIFCKNQQAMMEVANHFKYMHISNIQLFDHINDPEINFYEQSFLKSTLGNYKVIICSDYTFKRLRNVKNIDWIINYGLTENWDDFINRFRCMLDKFTSPLENPSKEKCMCYFIIDENDEIANKTYDNFTSVYSTRIADKLKLEDFK